MMLLKFKLTVATHTGNVTVKLCRVIIQCRILCDEQFSWFTFCPKNWNLFAQKWQNSM